MHAPIGQISGFGRTGLLRIFKGITCHFPGNPPVT
jgi:hypothetical protein